MGKRIGIFAFYDKDAIIDDYVIVYLESMKKVLDEIIFVSNGLISDKEQAKVSSLVNKVVIRNNVGFDAGAYKEVILGEREHISNSDELVLFNDTVFGPIYPMNEIFIKMRSRNLDLWGITKHAAAEAWGIPVSECIQSYFIVIEKRLLQSEDFYTFWEEQSSTAVRLEDVVVNFEFAFTNYFFTRGYNWDTYIDYSELDSSDYRYNFSPTYYANYELIKDKGFPFIKRKNFSFHDGYRLCNGEDIVKCYEYVSKNKLYDTKMIWKNILRIYDLIDIYSSMHLSYIANALNEYKSGLSATLCMNINNELTLNYFIKRLLEVECSFKKILLVKTHTVLNAEIKLRNNIYYISKEEILSSFTESDTDLFCYVSDVPHNTTDKIYSKSASYSSIDNAISSNNEIEDIKNLFKNNESLGVLMTPDSYIGSHCNSTGGVWNVNQYERVRNIERQIEIRYPIDVRKSQISNNNTFWCRKDAIEDAINKICELENIEFEDIVRLIPYIAAEKQYYTGMIMSNEQARIEYVNHAIIYGNFVGAFRNEDIALDFPLGYMRGITQISDFCEECSSIYIYGAGDYAQRVYKVLKNTEVIINAFVVKNKNENPSVYCGLPVVGIDEMVIQKDIGVIIGLSEEKQLLVKQDLRSRGVDRIYRL